jgi:hypothetical protein
MAASAAEKQAGEAPAAQMTRDEWLAFHVARAPKITPEQWERTLTLLHRGEYAGARAA